MSSSLYIKFLSNAPSDSAFISSIYFAPKYYNYVSPPLPTSFAIQASSSATDFEAPSNKQYILQAPNFSKPLQTRVLLSDLITKNGVVPNIDVNFSYNEQNNVALSPILRITTQNTNYQLSTTELNFIKAFLIFDVPFYVYAGIDTINPLPPFFEIFYAGIDIYLTVVFGN